MGDSDDDVMMLIDDKCELHGLQSALGIGVAPLGIGIPDDYINVILR